MLPVKFQPNPPGGSGKKAYKCFLRYMGMAAILSFES